MYNSDVAPLVELEDTRFGMRILQCLRPGPDQYFRRIGNFILPALATFAVFAFMSSWNGFLWPLVIAQTEAHMTLPVGLSLLLGRYGPAWNVVMAGSALSSLPILALYVFAQRYVVRGITFSGIKA